MALINNKLIKAYQTKSRKLQTIWTVTGFFLIDFIHSITNPNRHNSGIGSSVGGSGSDNIVNINDIDSNNGNDNGSNNMMMIINIKAIMCSLAFVVLYMSIMRHAYKDNFE